MNPYASRVLASALLVVVAGCSGGKQEDGRRDTSNTGQPADEIAAASTIPAAGEREAKQQGLRRLIDLIVAEAGDLPRTEFDPAALAASLGKDPQMHFEWVRDRTAWVPYRGLLRGSQGVMVDRLGSNLDRAILLGDLLRRAGHTVRLAHIKLSDDEARKRLSGIREVAVQSRNAPVAGTRSPERKRQIEEILSIDAASAEERADGARRLSEDARSLVRLNNDRLQAAIRDLAGNSAAAEGQAALAAMRDYWWVERKAGDRWIAMDLLSRETEPGSGPGTATAIIDWKAGAATPSIPEADWHAVQIRVVVERYENGLTSESTVLETTVRPASVFNRPIQLAHFPKQWPQGLPAPSADPNALGNAAINVREWIPQLRVGDKLIVQSGFTAEGVLIAKPRGAGSDIAAAGGGGFMSGFGEALGGGDTSSSSLTAEWIDYEIRVPGEPAQRVRRPVFDLLGPVLRSGKAEGFDANTNDRLIARSEALMSQTDIFLQPCGLTAEFASHLQLASIVAQQAELRELAAERDPAKARAKASALLDKLDFWGPLPDLARWRSLLGDSSSGWFVDQPNVLSYRFSPPVVNADRAAIKELIDIASNGIGVRPAAGRNAFQVRVGQGVADTVAEMVALGHDLRGAENTASIVALAAEADAGILLRPRDTAALQELGWAEDSAARLAANRADGYAVVALERPVKLGGQDRTGWWRVDPTTGETIGVMDTGYHQDLTERELTDFQLNYMMAYRHLYPPSTQARIAAEYARREFWAHTAPWLAFAAIKIVAMIAFWEYS